MKKTSLLLLLAAPILSVAASNYKVIISKTQHHYVSNGETENTIPEEPVQSTYDLSFQAWRDVSAKDLSLYMPMAMDGSSSGQAYYKINVGQ